METWSLIFASIEKGIFVLRKVIKWIDPFTEEEREKEFYFHIGMGDMSRVELEYGFQGGLEGVAKAVVEARDAEKILALFEKLVAMSYGVRTDDGDFVKTKEARDKFIGGRPYDALFYELVTSSEAGAEFLNAVMPAEVKKKVREMQRERGEEGSENLQVQAIPANKTKATQTPDFNLKPVTEEKPQEKAFDPFAKALSEYTYDELVAMPYNDFSRLLNAHKGQLPRALVNLRYQRDLAEDGKGN